MELTENKYASWASALICGISPLLFRESLKAEVYTLNSFLAISVFYLGLRILNGGDLLKNSLIGFFIIGLGMGNHHTIGFMGLIFLLPIAVRWKDISLKWIPLSILSFSAGFSINLFLYLRSLAIEHSGGLILYSYAGTWENFLRVFLRQDYKGSSTPDAIAGFLSFGKSWFYGFKNSLYYVALSSTRPILPFLILGFIKIRKKVTILFYFVLSFIVWFGVLGGMVCPSSELKPDEIQTISVYFLPAIPILYSLNSVGLATVIAFVKKGKWEILPRFIPYVIAVLPFVFLPFSFKSLSLNGNFLTYNYGRDMLIPLPLKSLLMNYTDNPMFTVFYMRMVERLREDMIVMNTSGREDIYGLESSPPWKYSKLYPEFYRNQKGTIKEINRDFALKGKLFANNPLELTEIVSRSYSYYPYIFSVALYPEDMKGIEDFKAGIRNNFRSNYEKINYEHAIELPPTGDFLVEELLTGYGLNTMIYGDFIKRNGEEERGNEFYKRAFLIGHPERFLWPYINFLLNDGRDSEAFALLKELKKVEGVYGEFARLLEEKALSIANEKKAKR